MLFPLLMLALSGSLPTVYGQSAETAAPAPIPELDFGPYYALVVGNNAYRHFPPLDTPIQDARALAAVLESRYAFKVQVLTDADRDQILAALERYRRELTEQDNFLLYFAGRGDIDRVNAQGYWLPVDAEPKDTTHWIANRTIVEMVDALPAKHVLVIADCGYSGLLIQRTTINAGQGRVYSADTDRPAELQMKWLELMIKTRSRTALTAGGAAPVYDSDGDGGPHSIFASALLAQLQSNREILESPLLAQTVARQVASTASLLGVEQVPQYAPLRYAGDLGAPFFFVPRK